MRSIFILTAVMAALTTVAACALPTTPPAVTPDTAQPQDAPANPKITVAQLLGQNDAWVRGNLGEPHFTRADQHANIWQYKNATCVLNLFLYADDKTTSGPAQVLHFDARDADGQNTDRETCLAALQN